MTFIERKLDFLGAQIWEGFKGTVLGGNIIRPR